MRPSALLVNLNWPARILRSDLFGFGSRFRTTPRTPWARTTNPISTVLLEDFKVRQDAAVVPAGTVSFRILNHGPTTHQLLVVRTDRPPDKLPLQRDGLTVNEEAPGIELLDEVEGLDIDDRQTLVLDLAAGNYVLYCNLEGHYLGGMHAAFTVR